MEWVVSAVTNLFPTCFCLFFTSNSLPEGSFQAGIRWINDWLQKHPPGFA